MWSTYQKQVSLSVFLTNLAYTEWIFIYDWREVFRPLETESHKPKPVHYFNMHEIDLNSAIDEIISGHNKPSEQQSVSRFFFIVGAGISCPVIPTARAIADDCKKQALERKAFAEPASTDPMSSYSYWFEKAFPHADQRTAYLRQLMYRKRISPANLRLAHLLQAGSVANIVVTSNFDDCLSRALRLFGASPILCDHPGTVRRLDGESSEIQILHVHGTYPFYDACNLDPEIRERALVKDEAEGPTVSSFLSHLLWKRSPIVVGYSGWEQDVIMKALKGRIYGQVLPVNLYWFCHERSTINTLPDWLRNHSQVRLVVADTPSPHSRDSATDTPLEMGSHKTLDAEHVFERFISKTKAQPPALFNNPIRSFAETLRSEIHSQEEMDKESAQNHYYLEHLVVQVTAAAEWLDSPEGYIKVSPSDHLVSRVLDASRRIDSGAVVETSRVLLGRQLAAAQRHEIVYALVSSIKQLDHNPTALMEACDLVFKFTARRESCKICDGAYIHACFSKGKALGRLSRHKDAIAEYDRCVKHATVCHDDVSRCSVLADALYCKAMSLESLGRTDDAVAAYEDLWKRWINIPDRHLRQLLARARTNAGMRLQEQGLDSNALESFRQVVKEFGNDEFEAIAEPIAKSLVHTGLLLEKGGDSNGALNAYNEVLDRFQNSEYEGVYDPVAKALANKTILLSNLGDSKRATAAANDFVERFGNTTDTLLLPVVIEIYQIRGRLLGAGRDHIAAVRDFDWIIDKLTASAKPLLIDQVATAWANRGVALLLLGRHDEGVASSDEVINLAKTYGVDVASGVAVLTALNNKIVLAEQRSVPEEVLAAKRLLVELLRDSSDPSIKLRVAKTAEEISYLL